MILKKSKSFKKSPKQQKKQNRKTSTPLINNQQYRHNSSQPEEVDATARFVTQTAAIDPQDGRINTNPGTFVPENYPKAEHVVSPHLRQFVHEIDETPHKSIRAPIHNDQLVPGYRYVLRHLKWVKDEQRLSQLKQQFRSDFDLLARETDLSKAEVTFDRTMPNLWSQLSVLRMNITKLRRPKIPQLLQKTTEYLGAQEGSGWFCAVPNNDDRFNKNLKSTSVVSKQSELFQQKAKVYNMDLHPADIARHQEMVERFHFNGKERSHNRF